MAGNFSILALKARWLFKFEMSIDYLSRIESEFPVFWEFLPHYEVKAFPPRFRAFLAHKGAPGEIRIRLLDRMYQRLGTAAFDLYQ